jgi:hypothetical protein
MDLQSGLQNRRLKERRWMEEAKVASAAGIQGSPSCSADAYARKPYGLVRVYLE